MGMLNKQKNIQIAALNARGMTVEAIAKKAGVDVQAVKESLEERQRTYIELSAWSEEQVKAYISDLQSKGKSVSEIAELTGLNTKKVNEIIFKKAEEELLEVGKVEVPEKKRGGHSRLTELIKNKIVELKEQGKSDAAIAKELGIGKSSVYRTWTEHKGESKPSKINEEFDKAVDDMITEAKKEPAPAATDTSSTKNENKSLSTNNDIIDEPKSQALSGISGSNNIEAALEEWLGNEKEIVYLKADTESAEVRFKCDGRVYSMTFRRYA